MGKESPWTKGDEPLCPYELVAEAEEEHLTPQQKVKNSPWLTLPKDNQETAVKALLRRYMKDEVFGTTYARFAKRLRISTKAMYR